MLELRDATAKTLKEFMKRDIIHPFGPPKVAVSDNAGCFTAVCLGRFMKQNGTTWKPVSAYPPMSDGKAERMVETIKKADGRLVEGDPGKWGGEI